MGTDIRLRRGNKENLPASAPSGTPLWCEDSKELFIGTGSGVFKIGNQDLSKEVDTTNTLNLMGVSSSNASEIKRNPSVTMQGGNLTATNFVGNLLGKANSADKLQTARTIALSGDVTGSGTFDGSNNLTLNTKINGDSFPLFATMTIDKTLSAEESVGWLEQGSLVTNVYSDAVNAIKNEYNNGVANTQLIEENWIQPTLSANGTLGGSNFAVAASTEYSTSYQAYMAFRGDDETSYWHSASESNWSLTFYNPTAIKVSKLDLTIHSTSHIPTGGKLQVSNNGTSWTDICNFTNTTAVNTADKFVIDARNNTTFYKYYKIVFTGSSSTYVNISEVVIWATYLVDSFPYRVSSNGHKIALSAYKSKVDNLYNREGVADFYVLDQSNNQFYLPRDIGAPLTRHIVKSYRYGSEWLDLYNDGWAEQGGEHYQYTNTSAANSYNRILLHRHMRTVEYSVNANLCDAQYHGDYLAVWGRTTNAFHTYVTAAYKKVLWKVTGWTAKPTLSEYDSDILAKLQSKHKYYKLGNIIHNTDSINIANVLSDISSIQTALAKKAEKTEIPQQALFRNFYQSPRYDFAVSSWITINHNLNLTEEQMQKAIIVPCLVCKVPVAGYDLNQIIQLPTILGYGDYPLPQPYVLESNKITQRTADAYAFWINRYNRTYGRHYVVDSDIVNCFQYFVKIWY